MTTYGILTFTDADQDRRLECATIGRRYSGKQLPVDRQCRRLCHGSGRFFAVRRRQVV